MPRPHDTWGGFICRLVIALWIVYAMFIVPDMDWGVAFWKWLHECWS